MNYKTQAKKRRRLLERWGEQGGRCYWCKRITVLIFRTMEKWPPVPMFRPDEATTEHLRSKLDTTRQEAACGDKRIVMACRKCNNERGALEVMQLCEDELHRRSGHLAKESIDKTEETNGQST